MIKYSSNHQSSTLFHGIHLQLHSIRFLLQPSFDKLNFSLMDFLDVQRLQLVILQSILVEMMDTSLDPFEWLRDGIGSFRCITRVRSSLGPRILC